MENQKYKELFKNMMLDTDFDFGIVSGSNSKFYVRASGYRITWDRLVNTVQLPSLDNDSVLENATSKVGLTPAQMVERLKGWSSIQTYYIPTSQEDEFQASTASVGNILPYELVEYLERLLSVARERISLYSINERKYK